jgi:glycosyltransferase involved in cell wall biosynthesis
LNLGITEDDIRAQRLAVEGYTADSTKAAALLSEVEGVPVPFVPSLGGFAHKSSSARNVAEHFGTMSRLDPVKRVHIAVAAFQHFTDGSLTIYGDGSEMDVVRASIHELGLGDRVRLGGVVAPVDVPAALDDLDVLLLPSADSEGTPVAVLESMSRARSVIATRVGGLPDIIEDGISGLFFDGSPSQLSEKLKVVTQPGVARQLGDAARTAWTERFSPDRVVEQFEALYDSLTTDPSRTT